MFKMSFFFLAHPVYTYIIGHDSLDYFSLNTIQYDFAELKDR